MPNGPPNVTTPAGPPGDIPPNAQQPISMPGFNQTQPIPQSGFRGPVMPNQGGPALNRNNNFHKFHTCYKSMLILYFSFSHKFFAIRSESDNFCALLINES